MLNRRVLRIKGMQTLFAYYQVKEANFLLAQDYISKSLQPNLNLDVPENKIEMAEKEKEALALFLDWRKSQKEIEDDDQRVEDTVEEAIAMYGNLVGTDKKNIGQRMLTEIENLYSLYFLCLKLIIEITELNIENSFGKNSVVQNFKDNQSLQDQFSNRNSSWTNQIPLLKKINNEIIHQSEEFKKYLAIESPKEEETTKIINFIFKDILLKDEEIIDFFEKRDLYWVENKNVLRSMLKKTIKESGKKGVLHISENWDDDKIFFKELFEKTIEHESFFG